MQNISHSFPSRVHQLWCFWILGNIVVSKSKSVALDVGGGRALEWRLCRNRTKRVVSSQASHTSTLGLNSFILKPRSQREGSKDPSLEENSRFLMGSHVSQVLDTWPSFICWSHYSPFSSGYHYSPQPRTWSHVLILALVGLLYLV